jgi:hypothetical protein
MDIGVASAPALSNYQATPISYGQGATSPSASPSSSTSTAGSSQNAAVLQALASTYTSLTTDANGILPAPDALSALAGSSGALGPLVSGIYSASVANGNTSFSLPGLSASAASVGGLNATAASILFSGTSTQGSDGPFASAINLNAALALVSYSDSQNGIPNGTLGAAATAASAGLGLAQPTGTPNAVQSAQSSLLTDTLNLLA